VKERGAGFDAIRAEQARLFEALAALGMERGQRRRPRASVATLNLQNKVGAAGGKR